MISRFFVSALLAVLSCAALAQPVVPGGGSGAAGRAAIGYSPTSLNTSDATYALARNTQRGPAYVFTTVNQPDVQFMSTVDIDGATGATVSCNSTTSVTVTLPGNMKLPSDLTTNGAYLMSVTGACNIINPIVTAVSGSNPYTVTIGSASGVGTGTNTTGFQFYPRYANSNLFPANPAYQTVTPHKTIMVQCTLTTSTPNTLACPTGTFNTNADVTQSGSTAQFGTSVYLQDGTGTCQDFTTQITSSTTTTATLATPWTGCSAFASRNVTIWLATQSFLFSNGTGLTNNMVGQTCNLPGLSNGNDLTAAIATYVNPFHVTLASNAGTTAGNGGTPMPAICGTDDSAKFKTMTQAAVAARIRVINFAPPSVGGAAVLGGTSGVVGLFNHDFTYAGSVIGCNDGLGGGNVAYPDSNKREWFAAPCSPGLTPPAIKVTMTQANFPHTMGLSVPPKIAIFGDSGTGVTPNGLDTSGNASGIIADILSAGNVTNRGTPSLYNFSMGGTPLWQLWQSGPVAAGSSGSGIPPTSAINANQFYTTAGQKWIVYAQNVCADVIVIDHSAIDGANMLWSAYYGVLGYFRTTYNAACGFTPDVVWLSYGAGVAFNPTPTSNSAQENARYATDLVRTSILAGDTNGVSVSLVDVGTAVELRHNGTDIETPVLARATYNVGPILGIGSPQFSLPYTWPKNVRGYGMKFANSAAGSLSVSAYWAAIGAQRFAIGNGTYGNPVGAGTQSGATTAYPGNSMVVDLDPAGNLNWRVTGYTFDFTVSMASCSITSGTATLTCTVAPINMGHAWADIVVQGAGAATCPTDIGGSNCLNTTILDTGVSADGKTITLAANASVTVAAAATKLRVYHRFLQPTVTPFLSTQTPPGGGTASQFLVSQNGSRFALLGNSYTTGFINPVQIWAGQVAKFGGYYKPTVTSSLGTLTNCCTWAADGNSFQTNSEDDPPYTSLYARTITDDELWGPQNGLTGGGQVGPYGGSYTGHWSGLGGQILRDVGAANAAAFQTSSLLPLGSAAVIATTSGYTVPANQGFTKLTPAGTLATCPTTLPSVFPQGQRLDIFTSQIITSWAVSAPTGFTIDGTAVAAGTANQTISYRLNGTIWTRVQ